MFLIERATVLSLNYLGILLLVIKALDSIQAGIKAGYELLDKVKEIKGVGNVMSLSCK